MKLDKKDISVLLEMQEMTLEVEGLQKRLEETAQELGLAKGRKAIHREEAVLQKREEALARAKRDLKGVTQDVHSLQQQIESEERKREEFGASDFRRLQQFEEEMVAIRAKKEEVEKSQGDKTIQVENLEKSVRELHLKHSETREKIEEREERFRAKSKKTGEKVESLRAKVKELTLGLSDNKGERFLDMATRAGGVAIAAVERVDLPHEDNLQEGNFCTACQAIVPVSVLEALDGGETAICTHCRRVLIIV
ncbi:hypothetical protein H8D30_04720 [bacterium]|nr:hypothetical protein [bacterium]